MIDVFFFFSSRRRHTRYWRDWSSDVCSSDLLGGLAARMPWAGGLLALGALAAMGLPGLAVFVSEFMSIMGGYETFPVQGVLAALGIVLSAMYLLYMLARVIFGPVERPAYEEVTDAG